MTASPKRREFRRESFACTRDWVHFCFEFELKPCTRCRSRARIRIGAPEVWECRQCAEGPCAVLPLHPDLWDALDTGIETETSCPICRERVPLGHCWISEEARRLYCAAHLRPIETGDRLRRAENFFTKKSSPSERPTLGSGVRILRLAQHLAQNRCGGCPFNGSGIYGADGLVEIDPDRRRCTSVPDSLNCADIDH